MVSRFSHIVVCTSTSFPSVPKDFAVWINHIEFTCSSDDGHLSGFHLLVAVNNTAVDIHAHVFVWMRVLISPGCVTRIVGPHGTLLNL